MTCSTALRWHDELWVAINNTTIRFRKNKIHDKTIHKLIFTHSKILNLETFHAKHIIKFSAITTTKLEKDKQEGINIINRNRMNDKLQ